jgi:hypothetical protein
MGNYHLYLFNIQRTNKNGKITVCLLSVTVYYLFKS